MIDDREVPSSLHESTKAQLRQFIERIERLEEDKKALMDEIKDVKSEMKATGFDIKAVNELLRRRKKDKAKREEDDSILAVYEHAIETAAATAANVERTAQAYAGATS
jgi:uncharacterized protein (UPF0335 family)